MGCDIHLYAEYQQPDGSWVLPTEPNPYYTPVPERRALVEATRTGKASTELAIQQVLDDPDAWDRPVQAKRGYHTRNYGLFAILAGVRNGSGFAGSDLGDPTVPISEPKGIPLDASPAYLEEVESWGVDGHSHSYFTLADLYRHDWDANKVTNRMQVRRGSGFQHDTDYPRGITNADEFATKVQDLLQQHGNDVLSWSAWKIDTCSWSSEGAVGGWRPVEYTTSHRDNAGPEWFTYLFDLASDAYIQGLSADQVRISFFFDN